MCAGARFQTAKESVDGPPDGFRYHDLRHFYASLLIAREAKSRSWQVKVVASQGHGQVKVVQAPGYGNASATTALDHDRHLWPDGDEATRTAVEAVLVARAESMRTQEVIN